MQDSTTKAFSTAEKFLMIAHHPEKGRFMISPMYIQYGIAGAILLDMTLEDRLDMTGKRLMLKTAKVSSDPVISEVSALISQSDKPRKAEYWVRKLATSYNRYKWQVMKSLADKRVVRIEERRFLGIIPYKQSFFIESYTRGNLIRRLRSDLLNYRGVSGDNEALAGLVEACRMHRLFSSDRDELKQIKAQLKKVIKESPVSDAVMQTVRQVQAAVMASITAAIVASTAGRR